MTEYCETKEECVQYVGDMLTSSFLNEWPWTMTINPVPFGGYAVHSAIGTELEDTVENTYKYLKTLFPTSTETTHTV